MRVREDREGYVQVGTLATKKQAASTDVPDKRCSFPPALSALSQLLSRQSEAEGKKILDETEGMLVREVP